MAGDARRGLGLQGTELRERALVHIVFPQPAVARQISEYSAALRA